MQSDSTPQQPADAVDTLFHQRVQNLVKVYDESGPTYRNEDLDKLKPLVRQREFHRSEFIYIGSKNLIQVAKDGAVTPFDRTTLKRMLRSSRIRIFMDLGQGDCESTGWGTDFSYEYVRINSAYTT